MNNPTDDGGPAFPFATVDGYLCLGMTLRDYFAAKAIPVATKWEEDSPTYDNGQNPTFQGVAERAYLLADAMLKARKP